MTKPKSAPAAKSRVVKPASPKKARNAPNMRDNFQKKKEKPVPTIHAHGFQDPVAAEAYEYTITPTKPGFVNKYRMWSRGELEVEALTEANFVGLKVQRDNGSAGNEPLLDDGGYARVWMIRYPPGNESTSETRKEGLRVLKDFFMSNQATDYPPSAIKLVDVTCAEPADVLETFFLDADIEEIVKASIDITEVEEDFYEKFTAFAETIYLQKEPSAFAKEILGFPSLESE